MSFSIVTVLNNSYIFLDQLFYYSEIGMRMDDYGLNKIYLVDNGSNETFRECLDGWLKQYFSPEMMRKVEIIKTKYNYLFSIANNIVINKFLTGEDKSDYLVLVNPDISGEILGVIDRLTAARYCGILGAKLQYKNSNLIEFAGGLNNEHVGFLQPARRLNNTLECEWITGAFMVIHKDIINKIGMLDQKNHSHWVSDQEYCRRAKLAMPNIKIWCCNSFTLLHNQGGSTEKKSHDAVFDNLPTKPRIYPNVEPISLAKIKEIAEYNSTKIPLIFYNTDLDLG